MKRSEFIKKISLGIGAMLAAPKIVEGLGEEKQIKFTKNDIEHVSKNSIVKTDHGIDSLRYVMMENQVKFNESTIMRELSLAGKFSKQAQANRLKIYRDMQKDIKRGAIK